MTTDLHVPDITMVTSAGVSTWIARCPACDWIDAAGGVPSIVQNSALSHEWELHPERRPPDLQPNPTHGLREDSTTRFAVDGSLRIQCWCGLVRRGPEDAVRFEIAEHCSRLAPKTPNA